MATLRPEPTAVESEEARFRGVAIMPLNNEERVLLHYDVYDPTNAEVADQYFVPPLAVLESVVDQEHDHPLFEVIEKTKYFAERMFHEQDFFQQSVERQAVLLRKHVSKEFVAEATIDYTDDVLLRIGCDWYYQLPLVDTLPDDWSPYIVLENSSMDGLILIPLAAARSFASDIDNYV